MYLFAQAVLVLIYLCPLTVSADIYQNKGKKAQIMRAIMIGILLLLGTSCLFFGATLTSLCLDGLLAAACIGLMCFVLNYKGTIQKKVLFSIPLLVSVISIKDNGLLYALSAACMLMVFINKHSRITKHRIILSVLPFVSVLIIEFLWQNHISTTFEQFDSAPHSLSISRWLSVFHTRSPEEISTISKLFLNAILGKRVIIPFFGIIAVLFVVYWMERFSRDSRSQTTKELILFTALNYAIYLCGLAFVYLFSMEIEGAIRLESFSRYSGVEFCFLFGVCISHLSDIAFSPSIQTEANFSFILETKDRALRLFRITNRTITLVMCTCLVFVLSYLYCDEISLVDDYLYSSRKKIHMLTNEEYRGDALIYAPSQMDGYYNEYFIGSCAMYDFQSIMLSIATLEDMSRFENLLTQHSHILIYDADESMNLYLHENGWQNDCSPGLYRIENGKIIEN